MPNDEKSESLAPSLDHSELLGQEILQRVERLSDGIFAFAMVIMVLAIELPERRRRRDVTGGKSPR